MSDVPPPTSWETFQIWAWAALGRLATVFYSPRNLLSGARRLWANPLYGMRVAPSRFDQLVAGRFEPHLTCRYFDSTLWRDRDQALGDIGFNPLPRGGWHEVDRRIAIDLLSTAMSFDLCYGVKSMPSGTARELAEQFLSPFHWQDQLFTNSEQPWSPDLNAWAFGSLTDATIDTGVIARSGDLFAGML